MSTSVSVQVYDRFRDGDRVRGLDRDHDRVRDLEPDRNRAVPKP